MGLAYLDAKAPNLLVAYTLLTVATLPLDAVTLCMLGHPASFLQWARSTAYFFILIFKCASLVLMGMLHTKARPTRPIAPTTANSNSHAACTLNVTHTAARACAALVSDDGGGSVAGACPDCACVVSRICALVLVCCCRGCFCPWPFV